MKIVNCRSCGKSIVFMVNNLTGKMIPVETETISWSYDLSLGFNSELGHVNHFKNCPNRDYWRRSGKVGKVV